MHLNKTVDQCPEEWPFAILGSSLHASSGGEGTAGCSEGLSQPDCKPPRRVQLCLGTGTGVRLKQEMQNLLQFHCGPKSHTQMVPARESGSLFTVTCTGAVSG